MSETKYIRTTTKKEERPGWLEVDQFPDSKSKRNLWA